MIRIVVGILLLVGSVAVSGAQFVPPSEKERVQALAEFAAGKPEAYGRYLESLLDVTLKQLKQIEDLIGFNDENIRAQIEKDMRANGYKVTRDEVDAKVEEARNLLLNNNFGQPRTLRDKARDLCNALASFYSVRSKY